jgi:hypothetical protein
MEVAAVLAIAPTHHAAGDAARNEARMADTKVKLRFVRERETKTTIRFAEVARATTRTSGPRTSRRHCSTTWETRRS